ncbi:MAG: sugar ABC transporter permease [Candidatus Eisenbacteria bacterium]|uniref:Sugar ABC transporter permease n=1 Tax=Eiseniibacteriota bacterium TaxID=2212470 RepID=A0A538TBA9_UNCEI|nr:MAG: sugar ABC transporter permease [Candidatus Eisenbacteria bacterium]
MRSRAALGLLPWSLCFAVFGLIPLFAALVLSFYSMNPLRPDLTHWIGAMNYTRALGSPAFWHALRTTGIFVVGTLPVTLVLAYIVAALLGRLRRGEAFFRAAIFFPATLSMVVISLVFKSLYAEQGLLNGWLAGLGLPRLHWLQDSRLALPSIMAMDVWASVGYYAILILAGRKTLPLEQLEAARLEGLGPLAIERRIVLPHVKPVILFVILLNTIRSFQIFIEVFVLTRGGPLQSTLTLVYHLYERAFYHFEMGYACAIAYILLLLVGGILLLQRRVLSRSTAGVPTP